MADGRGSVDAVNFVKDDLETMKEDSSAMEN